MVPLLAAMRPAQWSKNLFVLAPLVFAGLLDDPVAVTRALVAFAAFCAAASGLYLVNDVRDRAADRQHPLKCRRPVASGALAVRTALSAAALLAALALAAGWWLGRSFLLVLVAYLALITAYSLLLKRLVIVDVMTISIGFVLRVLAGAAAIGAVVSSWLVLCTIFVALFLAFSKRRHELVLLADEAAGQRSVLSQYSPAFLDQMINVVTASTVLAYALYASAPETVHKFPRGQWLIYTVPLTLFGVFRYLYLIYQRPTERNPTEAILFDPPFLINVALWGAAVLWVVYGG